MLQSLCFLKESMILICISNKYMKRWVKDQEKDGIPFLRKHLVSGNLLMQIKWILKCTISIDQGLINNRLIKIN